MDDLTRGIQAIRQRASQGRGVLSGSRIPAREIARSATLILYVLALVACGSVTAVPAPTPNIGSAADQLARGAPLYTQNCATATCHGLKGEGIREGSSFRAWPLLGSDFESRNPNAQVDFDVVRSGDEQNLRTMTDQEIYDAIAYELSLNGVHIASPLAAQNSTTTPTGAKSQPVPPSISPPLGNAQQVVTLALPKPFLAVANDEVGLRVDQIVQASAIGQASPPEGGTFLILVVAMQDLTDHPLDVGPKFLRLVDSVGDQLEPQTVAMASAVETFHELTIGPEHGTAAIVAFALPRGTIHKRLVYDDGTDHVLSLNLTP